MTMDFDDVARCWNVTYRVYMRNTGTANISRMAHQDLLRGRMDNMSTNSLQPDSPQPEFSQMDVTSLCNLPDDALVLIGAHLAHPSRDLSLACKDAAACAMVGSPHVTCIAESAWKRCAQVAETIDGVDHYQESWGAECPDGRSLKKHRVLKLARACPEIRPSSTLFAMCSQLGVYNMNVGPSCPVPRPIAHFLLQISQSVINITSGCPAFRDKDLSACFVTHRPSAPGKRYVRLRDAMVAPELDRAAIVCARMDANQTLDAEFARAGFVRNWRETDLERRKRIQEAIDWARSVDAQSAISVATQMIAQRGDPVDYDSFSKVVMAYRVAGFAPRSAYQFMYTRCSSNTVSEARGDIYGQMQLQYLGHIMFKTDAETIMPTLAPSEISDARNDLLFHAIARREVLSAVGPGTGMYNSLLNEMVMADSVEDANTILAEYAAEIR
jgi:hypothetical protein